MDLTDNEIWYLSYLEILNEEENCEWEGFGILDPDEKKILIKERFESIKTSIAIEKNLIITDLGERIL